MNATWISIQTNLALTLRLLIGVAISALPLSAFIYYGIAEQEGGYKYVPFPDILVWLALGFIGGCATAFLTKRFTYRLITLPIFAWVIFLVIAQSLYSESYVESILLSVIYFLISILPGAIIVRRYTFNS